MLKVKRRAMTVHDYALLPDAGPRFQLIDGEFHMAPAPNTFHQVVSRNLQFIIQEYLNRNPIGELFNAPFDVYLSDIDVFQPDLCFYSFKQQNYVSEKGGIRAPRLVIEILSPSNAHLDTGPKREVYARTGVRELWIVDPPPQEIAVYTLQEDAERPARVLEGDVVLTTPFLPGLEIPLPEVFKV